MVDRARIPPDGAFPYRTSPLLVPERRDGVAGSGVGALEILGMPWNLRILHEVLAGTGRFTDLQRKLGISRKVLTRRLHLLTSYGILERHPYDRSRSDRYEYRLSAGGEDLSEALGALLAWGRRHLPSTAEVVSTEHRSVAA